MTFTHIFINSSKIYFLNRISETRSRYSFNVIKTESRNKEITKSPKTLKKFKDDINLFTFEEWDKSNKQIITLPGIKNIYFLGIDVIDKYKSYVPKIEVYKFPTDLKSILVDIKNNYFQLAISDNGAGILPENYDKIFLPFFSTKEVGKGIGMGLSLSLGIIQSIGGDLWLDKESKSTRFIIKLPLQL